MTTAVVIQSCAGLGGETKKVSAHLGHHIRTNPRPIASYCLKPLGPASEDVATIMESIALTDRLQTRHRSQGWPRRIAIEIPVYEFETFASSSVRSSLLDVATFLTGDVWHISFSQRSGTPIKETYLPLAEQQPEFVVPFSDGLDSFAQSELLRAAHGNAAVLAVQAGKLQRGSENPGAHLVQVPRRFYAGHHREQSYRSRPLVYFAFAGIAAATVRAKAVVIGESGQGALGPSFARFGNEWPLRSAHPGFTTRLSKFLSQALGSLVQFQLPQLWRTKGDILSELKDRGLLNGWSQTRSCSVRPFQRHGRAACGICGGCLLRQTALNAAGIGRESNLAFEVSESDLVVRQKDDSASPMSQNEKEILARAALSMTLFAEVSEGKNSSEVISREARDIPDLSSIRNHATEWRGLLESLPPQAWLRRQFLGI